MHGNVVVTARLDGQAHERLNEFAKRDDRSASRVVRRAVEEYVRRPRKRATQ